MDELPGNPQTNRLPSQFKEDRLTVAVEKSGFPLQTIVAHALARDFPVIEEEWSYIDSDEDKLRTIDVYGLRQLDRNADGGARSIAASLILLVECKRSDTPYVFHLRNRTPPLEFPTLCGLPSSLLEIWTDNRTSTSRSVIDALGITSETFVANAFPVSYSFTRVRLASSDVKLSDDNDTYPQLILPLLKATRHLAIARADPRGQGAYFVSAAIPVAVLDAPMIGAWYLNGRVSLTLVPWVRVVRHSTEFNAREKRYVSSRFAVDVIHRDYLDTYVTDHLLPFGDHLATRVHAHEPELLAGKGAIEGLFDEWIEDLGTRLRPV